MTLGKPVEPVAQFRFGIELEGLVVGWFTECSGLAVERSLETYEEGGANDFVHQLPGPIKHTNITFQRGISDPLLWEWFAAGGADGHVKRRNVSIILYGVDYHEVRRWNLTNAYPVRWNGPTLQSDSAQLAVESIEIAQGVGGVGSASGEVAGMVQRTAEEGGAQPANEGLSGEVDVDALARKVYDLLRRELDRECERSIKHWR